MVTKFIVWIAVIALFCYYMNKVSKYKYLYAIIIYNDSTSKEFGPFESHESFSKWLINHEIEQEGKVRYYQLEIHLCSQVDESGLTSLSEKAGGFDIVIDDASHINPLSIKTFEIMFPLLKNGGYYVLEDYETSYWKLNYDGNENITDKNLPTALNYFMGLIHNMNHEYILPEYELPYKGMIEYIHFYKTLIIVKKCQ